MSSIRLAKDLTLPLEAVTQTIAILAKRRAGKSYTMRRLAEQLFKARQQIVLVDPKGDQWGIRSAADGKGPGLAVVILGGERGDVPLESNSGEIVAKLVVEERVSVVLDLSLFRKSEVATFMTAFLENLYRLKAKEAYRTPVMLVIDEADAIAPQKPQSGEERMLGAAEDIVRRGGQRGIGCVLVTQRSAVLNKNVLTQAQMLVALRTIAPQDLKAMDAWIQVHGEPEQRAKLMESLPSLPVGEAWFWSPGWPTVDGIFKRVHVLPIETFDSGATPKPGEKRTEPKTAADVDLEALKRQMVATIEKAKAEDPKLLRKKITELERELSKKKPAAAPSKGKPAGPRPEDLATIKALRKALENAMKFIIEISAKGFDGKVDADALQKALAGAAQAAASIVERHVDQRNREFARLRQQGENAVKGLQALLERDVTVKVDVRHNDPFTVSPGFEPRPRPSMPAAPPRSADSSLSGAGAAGDGSNLPVGELAIMRAVAQHHPSAARDQLSILTGYKRSTRNTYIQRLEAKGFVRAQGENVFATDEGIAALGTDYEPLPTGPELQGYWLARLPEGERAILRIVLEQHPNAVPRERLSVDTGYKRSTRNTYIQRLVARRLVAAPGDEVNASEVFFQ